MKNKLIIIILALMIILPVATSAYTLLQKLPESGDPVGKTTVTGLSDYLTWLYRFALGAAIFLAVLKIVIGGVLIIVGGASEGAQSKGRDMIEMALWGLLLALCAWLLLNAINPDFVKGKFGLEPVTIERASATPAMEGEWVTKLADDSKNRDYLKSYYIFSNKGPCPNSYSNTNCTMLSDLPQNAVDGIIKIKQESGAAITITGGTETGIHKEHGPNKPVLDVRYKNTGGENTNTALKIYLDKQVGKTMKVGDRLDTKDGKMNILFEKNGDGSEHFHITFK